jgi:hypothetical protein
MIKTNDKYTIQFDATSLPPNFNKWEKLNIDEALKNKKNFRPNPIFLNDYISVVIKSHNNHIGLILGGVECNLNNDRIYFLFFPKYHDCYLKIVPSDNIEIYIPKNPDTLLEIQKLNKSLEPFEIIFDKIYSPFKMQMQMIWTHFNYSPFNLKKIDENEFYFDFEQKYKEEFGEIILNQTIELIDKYVQYDIIKIFDKKC